MSKCDGCYERVAQGMKPVCVESCPQRALDFDDIEVIRAKHGTECGIAPMPDPSLTNPNIVIKAHKDANLLVIKPAQFKMRRRYKPCMNFLLSFLLF